MNTHLRLSRLSFAILVATGVAACLDTAQLQSAYDAMTSTSDQRMEGLAFRTTGAGSVDNTLGFTPVALSDAAGKSTTTVTDPRARYALIAPTGYTFPLTLTVTGGVDLVSGLPAAFDLLSATTNPATILNASPHTTLAAKTAAALGGFDAANRAVALDLLYDEFGFGLDRTVVPDPFTTPANENTTAIMVKSATAMAETLERTTESLVAGGMEIDANQVIHALAGDLSDGVIDGKGPDADPRIAATANVVSAQVLYEAMRNRLIVRGSDGRAAMDDAILTVTPLSTKTTASVPVSTGLLQQARVAVAAAMAAAPSAQLTEIASTLSKYTTATSAATLDTALAANGTTPFTIAISTVSTGSQAVWDKVNTIVENGGVVPTPPPPTTPPPPPPPTVTPGAFEWSAANYSAKEGNGAVQVTVRRVNGADGSATVQWRTLTFDTYGTADWTNDYGTTNWQTLNFANGETSKVISISITDDALLEGDETFSVLLGTPTGGTTLGTIATAKVTILDNEVAPPVGTLKYPPDTTLTMLSIPNVAKPGYLSPMTDPVFKTRVTRVTDNAAMGTSFARHYYAKNSAWNSDGSLIVMNGSSESSRFLLDGKTYKVVGKLTVGLGELVWSNTTPNRMFAVLGTTFKSINPTANTATTLRTFAYDRCHLGPWEGNVSADDRYAALACQKGADLVVVVYDILNNTIPSTRTFAGKWGDTYFDWVTISASGKYVVINWREGLTTTVYDRTTLNQVASAGRGGTHGDLGLDAAGEDVHVAYDAYGGIKSYRLRDGYAIQVLPTSANILGGHISCRNIRRPGWAYVSPYDAYGKATTKDVYAVKLDGSGTVQRFAHHHSTAANYYAMPMAVPSMDGTKVMFGSDWDGGSENSSYVAEMP